MPLIGVPSGAVVIERTWHVLQPIASKIAEPAMTSGVIGPRDGTLVERMNVANRLMSSSVSSPQTPSAAIAHG